MFTQRPTAPHHIPPPPTTANLDYADLAIIDLTRAATPADRSVLAKQTRDAMVDKGFFYVVGHGYTPDQTARMFDIADIPFTQVGDEEKQLYAGNIKESGSYQGYKLRNYWRIDGGVRDQLENYNINRDVTKKTHPSALRPFIQEIADFAKFNHGVLHEILRLLALGLELPEETLVNIHNFDAVGETYVRFMKYYPRSEEEESKTKNVWLKGHTDFGSITMLWSQPVAALQILARDGTWKWVRHIPNALVINAGDALAFLTAGVYAGTVHRVVQPPADQITYTRLGVFYFTMPDDVVRLAPLMASPVVAQRLKEKEMKACGDASGSADHVVPTMEVWRKGRTSAYGQTELTKSKDGEVEEELINGLVVKHYN